ncbi:uncharacterized protein LOC116416690 [Nasonia vitripennis]|uniref:Uncharacterized protein n=1 Tax=Nasonia vitripennis TaxID=7425 RepID=A0A7M7Q7U2_NASVI|nr:uncharacterized protein LOC116416690 [Nasonia vitripennis]
MRAGSSRDCLCSRRCYCHRRRRREPCRLHVTEERTEAAHAREPSISPAAATHLRGFARPLATAATAATNEGWDSDRGGGGAAAAAAAASVSAAAVAEKFTVPYIADQSNHRTRLRRAHVHFH